MTLNKQYRRFNKRIGYTSLENEWVDKFSFYLVSSYPVLEYCRYRYMFAYGQVFIQFKGDI